MYIYFDELGNGKGGTEVEICQVDRAERSIVRHDRVEQDVHGGEGGDVGGGRAGGKETISARSPANSAVNTCEKRQVMGGTCLAEATPFRRVSRCPNAVAKDWGGNLRTSVWVRRGIPWI